MARRSLAGLLCLSALSLGPSAAAILRQAGTPYGEQTPEERMKAAAHAPMGKETGTCRNLERLSTPKETRKIFCYIVVRPWGQEMPLLYEFVNSKLFESCNDYAIFSNATLKTLMTPENASLVERAVNFAEEKPSINGTMDATRKKFLDTSTMQLKESARLVGQMYADFVWPRVAYYARKKDYDWVVKVDITAVFLPMRLKYVLAHTLEPEDQAVALGTRGRGCKGIGGGVHVYSKKAIELLAGYHGGCGWTMDEKIKNGESGLADHCLRERGQIWPQKHIVGTQEVCCGKGCAWTVGVHGLKDADAWKKCLQDFQAEEPEPCSGQLSPVTCQAD